MALEDFWPLIPPIAFLIYIAIAYAIFKFGGYLGLKSRPEGEKLKTYACGEDYPAANPQHSYQFFYVAFFFTILHVVALMIATLPGGNPALVGIGYLMAMVVTVFALLRR